MDPFFVYDNLLKDFIITKDFRRGLIEETLEEMLDRDCTLREAWDSVREAREEWLESL